MILWEQYWDPRRYPIFSPIWKQQFPFMPKKWYATGFSHKEIPYYGLMTPVKSVFCLGFVKNCRLIDKWWNMCSVHPVFEAQGALSFKHVIHCGSYCRNWVWIEAFLHRPSLFRGQWMRKRSSEYSTENQGKFWLKTWRLITCSNSSGWVQCIVKVYWPGGCELD